MYLWKIKSLKEDIKNNKITKKEYQYYAIFFLLLYSTIFVLSVLQIYATTNIWITLLQIIISTLGIYYAYITNGTSKGKDFSQRLFSIGWVFLLRSIFFMGIGMLNLYIMTHLAGVAHLLNAQSTVAISLVFEILLYWRIGKHIQSLNSVSS